MIVRCLSYGSLWWLRPGQDVTDSRRYNSHAAIFNTTGFSDGARERRNWTVPGVIRLNVGTCIDQRLCLHRIEPGCFETPGLEHNGSQNRLLLQRRTKNSVTADMVLTAVSSATIGRISFADSWRSAGIKIVCASALNGVQETLLLMPAMSQITTTTGIWRLNWDAGITKPPSWISVDVIPQSEGRG